MSLFSTLFNVGIARRVGIWALIQALPDEHALSAYLHAAYKGLAVVIIGAVLTGSAIAAGLGAAYYFLLEIGWSPSNALMATAGFTLGLIVICFTLASHWFVRVAGIKDDVKLFRDERRSGSSIKSTVNDAITSVAEGFIEGLTSSPKQKPLAPSRRIRLIN